MPLSSIRRSARVATDTLGTAARLLRLAVAGDKDALDATCVNELIRFQYRLAKTTVYWTWLEGASRRGASMYRRYAASNDRAHLHAKARSLADRIERVLAAHPQEFAPYREANPVWVMSTGRCGIDSLDRFLKTSADLHSIHREFRGEKFYEHGSALKTKSAVFNAALHDRMSDDEILETIRKYLATRLKTLHRAAPRRLVFCEHHDEAWLPFIARVFPRSRFIHLRRRDVDVVQSYLSKGIYSGRQIAPVDPARRIPLEFWSLMALVSWFTAYVNLYIGLHCELIDQSRVLHLKSEELFSKDRAAFDRLRDFLTPAALDYDTFVSTFAQRHNAKTGGENACPRTDDWPQGLRTVLEIFQQSTAA